MKCKSGKFKYKTPPIEIEDKYFISVDNKVTQKNLNANECICYLINAMSNTPETRDSYTVWL